MMSSSPPKLKLTRYTNDVTFDHYDNLARIGAKNPHCRIGGRLEWYVKLAQPVEDEFFNVTQRTLGRFIRCTCGNKHDCFQASPRGNKKLPRISNHVADL